MTRRGGLQGVGPAGWMPESGQKTRLVRGLILWMIGSILFGFQNKDAAVQQPDDVRVLSVCDIIEGASKWKQSRIVVVGMLDAKTGGLSATCASCAHGITTGKVRWPNSLYLSRTSREVRDKLQKIADDATNKNDSVAVILIGYAETRKRLQGLLHDGQFSGTGFGPFGMFPINLEVVGVCTAEAQSSSCVRTVVNIQSPECVVYDPKH